MLSPVMLAYVRTSHHDESVPGRSLSENTPQPSTGADMRAINAGSEVTQGLVFHRRIKAVKMASSHPHGVFLHVI